MAGEKAKTFLHKESKVKKPLAGLFYFMAALISIA
jgi:hypothetical protein